ncbi:MAG: CHASE2 domain-containing protein [Desulfococcaceae bacterium]
MLKKLLKKYDVLFVILLFLFSLLAEYHEFFSLWEDQTVFFRHGMRSVFGRQEDTAFPLDRIALVSIDDRFFDEYGMYPLRRSVLAEIISNINALGAKVICVDLFLDLPDACGDDRLLAEVIDRSPVLLASRAVFDSGSSFADIRYPIPMFRKAGNSGYVNLTSPSSSLTFLSRLRILPEVTEREDGWPIAVQAVSAYLETRPVLTDNILHIGNISIPLDHFRDMYIDFSPIPEGYRFLYQYAGIPASEFLNISGIGPDETTELQMWVRDKIVIIGDTTAISHDWFDTPVGMIYGAEIIADTVSTLLRGAPLRPAPFLLEMLLSAFFVFMIILCVYQIRTLLIQIMAAAFLFAGFILFCTLLYVHHGTVFSMGYNLTAGICGYVILSFSAYSREKKLHLRQKLEKEQAERKRHAAEAANQAKSTFLANMSHELRTPLHAILGFAQIVGRSRNLSQNERDHLQIIADSGEHLLAIINQILDLSKVEAGRMSVNEKDFDLRNLLGEVENMFRIRAQAKGLRLIFETDPQLPDLIRTDRMRLRQILINLIGNAVKFTAEGSVWVRAGLADSGKSSSPKEEPVHMLRFEVEDTGPGIAAEERECLFNAFVQTETGRRSQEGSGLGLVISRQFVKLLGGDLTLISPCRTPEQTANDDRSGNKAPGVLFSFHIRAGLPDFAEKDVLGKKEKKHKDSTGKALYSSVPAEPVKNVPGPGVFANLPPDLPLNLRQAINELDDDRIRTLMEDIRKHDPALSESLGLLVREFRYEELLGILPENV